MSASLVGSEMCIRDRPQHWPPKPARCALCAGECAGGACRAVRVGGASACLLYTSDAADDM
eukprot:7706150-Alexandrium_andersonii.AAC.1